ncbi:MAG: tandem-95 repeat protein [Cyclobacteriaceae bacterium]
MKSSIFLIIIGLISLQAVAQGNNKKPKIVGQDALSTNEDQSITILMSHLEVNDPDDWFYPWGFTMSIYSGSDYTFSGHLVTPNSNFSGKLIVKVSVNDGQDNSNVYNLEVTVNSVNDKPVISGHSVLSTNQNQPISILPEHLKVTDPDDRYPDDFTIKFHAGNNYTVNGNQIIPQTDFNGLLSVNVSVNDGQLDSDIYALPIEVKVVNSVPLITGQSTLQVNEDEALIIQLAHLTVVDDDSTYPQGFTLSLSSGENYTVSNTTITPAEDFSGMISVPVTINDGKNTSKPFNLSITVTPVNDNPRINDLETEPIYYRSGDVSVAVSKAITISDVDGDSIMYAEVGFRAEGYQVNADKLVYTPPANSKIRAVFDAGTGILTLLGQASPASYSRALRSVHFQSLTTSSRQSKVLYFKANDGKSDSEILERDLVFGQATVSLDIPTGFTPNGDLSNDTWKIIPLKSEEEYMNAKIKVYNKAGAIVFETVGFQNEWDGRLNGELLPADTYFYTIDLNLEVPEGYVKGLVTILR